MPVPTPAVLLSSLNLSPELINSSNQVYFLHLLATESDRVVPPGKSILSMLSRPRTSGTHSETDKDTDPATALQKRVEQMIHKAFWDEAVKSLSDPLPANQIKRLLFLYRDILDAITPVFPAGHPVMRNLSSPNISSSTSPPLLSAQEDLRTVLLGLRERCAPVRDSQIDDILRRLTDSNTPLPGLIVDVTKSIIEIAAIIKDDLSQFILGNMSEDNLQTVIAQEAQEGERKIILSIWDQATLKQSCREWLNQLVLHNLESSTVDPHDHWKLRLLQALSSTDSITCSLPNFTPSESNDPMPNPDHSHNTLPPPFLFTAPTLFYIQNLLQAIIIAASLCSLVPLPPTSSTTSPDSTNFPHRIWALLKLEIDDELFTSTPESSPESHTKLIHLADEVVHAHRSAFPSKHDLSPDEETRLRAAVDRTLRTQDPVFLLLQKRLMDAIRASLLLRSRSTQSNSDVASTTSAGGAPAHLRTGRNVAKGHAPADPVRPRSMTTSDITPQQAGLEVKGFDDPVLVAGISEVWGKITRCIDWVEAVWPDVVATDDSHIPVS